MLRIVGLVLLMLWFIGWSIHVDFNGMIHVLLVAGILVFVVDVLRRRYGEGRKQ